MKALLVAPVFDEVTKYSYEWSREAKKLLEKKGYKVVDLSNREISRTEVEKALKDVDLFTFWNHGSESALWGSQKEPVVDINNVNMLSGKEVYTMACLSAKHLGVEAWKRKCKVYWGYYEPFAFTTDSIEEFKEFAIFGLKLRLEGKPWKECLQKTKELGYELADKFAQEGKYIAAVCMRNNTVYLRCYNAEPPSTKCRLRAFALRIFGKLGWYFTKLRAIALLLFGIGFGISLHDFCHALWEIGGYKEILSPQGGYIGFTLMLFAFIMEFVDFFKVLRDIIN